MKRKLDIRYFAHSWVSDWNHGNAHFLRGLARDLVRMGHSLRCYEQMKSWSLSNLINIEGERAITAIDDFRRAFPQLDVRFYELKEGLQKEMARELRGADVVIIHEWSDPLLVNAVLELKQRFGFRALFHDTHHRAYSAPAAILKMKLHLFDGVLVFGEAIRRIYADGFGAPHVWTFHEAADVENFRPLQREHKTDVLWVGNWGDEERTRELQEFLIAPAERLPGLKFVAHGVRYPEKALDALQSAGIEFRGYLPNLNAPRAYADSALALHVPRRQYANGLSGIPTIRMFEAMACGTPLLCSPWDDVEQLFHPGEDFVCAANGAAMTAEVQRLAEDPAARRQIAESALKTILARHTCQQRAAELTGICEEVLG